LKSYANSGFRGKIRHSSAVKQILFSAEISAGCKVAKSEAFCGFQGGQKRSGNGALKIFVWYAQEIFQAG